MRLIITATFLLYCFAPAAAQTVQQQPITVTCKSRYPAIKYFCFQYNAKQDAAWQRREKKAADKADFILRLDQFFKGKVIVGLTATLGDSEHKGTLTVAIDNKHLNASATKVVEATTYALDLWESGKK